MNTIDAIHNHIKTLTHHHHHSPTTNNNQNHHITITYNQILIAHQTEELSIYIYNDRIKIYHYDYKTTALQTTALQTTTLHLNDPTSINKLETIIKELK